jgi:hypothetical protein
MGCDVQFTAFWLIVMILVKNIYKTTDFTNYSDLSLTDHQQLRKSGKSVKSVVVSYVTPTFRGIPDA